MTLTDADEIIGSSVRAAARKEALGTFRRFQSRGPDYAMRTLDVVDGTLDGVIAWLILTHGRQAAYDFLHDKTESILVSDEGSKSHDEEKTNGEGPQ